MTGGAVRARSTVAITLAGAVLIGCGTATSPPRPSVTHAVESSTTTAPRALEPPRVDPALAGAFDSAVVSTMQSLSVPGVIARVDTPAGSWSVTHGVADLRSGRPIDAGDHVRIGSVTKTMVATVLLQLSDEGLIRLDDPVSRIRDDVPNGDAITVRMLLDMSSGLYSYTEDSYFGEAMDRTPQRVWTSDELLRIAWAHGPDFPPGARFRYSNTNTVLAAALAEQVTGRSWRDLVRERVIRPLGLAQTTVPEPGDHLLPSPSARGYLYGTNASAQISVQRPGDEVTAIRNGTVLPTDVSELDPAWIGAAGAVVSTVSDVADYITTLVRGGLSSPAMQSERLASITGVAPFDTVNYGLGWQAFGHLVGHDGAIPGYQTFAGHDPKSGVTIVVVCTVRDGPAGGRPANTIARAFADRLGISGS